MNFSIKGLQKTTTDDGLKIFGKLYAEDVRYGDVVNDECGGPPYAIIKREFVSAWESFAGRFEKEQEFVQELIDDYEMSRLATAEAKRGFPFVALVYLKSDPGVVATLVRQFASWDEAETAVTEMTNVDRYRIWEAKKKAVKQ